MNGRREKIQTWVVTGYTDMLGVAQYTAIAHLASPASVQASDVLLLYTGKQ